jgi:hypothetical protein
MRWRVVGLNLARLAAVKSEYDSANVFRVNQNIMPAAQALTRRPCCNVSGAARLPTRNVAVGRPQPHGQLSVSGKFVQIEGIKKRSSVCRANSQPQDRIGFSTNINFGIICVDMEYQRKIRIDPNGTKSLLRCMCPEVTPNCHHRFGE